MGNYNSHGGMKFIPEIPADKFKTIILSQPLAKDSNSVYSKLIAEVYPKIEKEIYAIDKPYKTLGFPSEGATTGYFGRNLDKNDLKLVQQFTLS